MTHRGNALFSRYLGSFLKNQTYQGASNYLWESNFNILTTASSCKEIEIRRNAVLYPAYITLIKKSNTNYLGYSELHKKIMIYYDILMITNSTICLMPIPPLMSVNRKLPWFHIMIHTDWVEKLNRFDTVLWSKTENSLHGRNYFKRAEI